MKLECINIKVLVAPKDLGGKKCAKISKHFIYLTLYIQMKIKNTHISYRASEQGTSLKQNTEVVRVAYLYIYIYTRCSLNTIQCVSIAAQV